MRVAVGGWRSCGYHQDHRPWLHADVYGLRERAPLLVCKWLFEVGAAADITKSDVSYGSATLMRIACVKDHLPVCEWQNFNGALNRQPPHPAAAAAEIRNSTCNRTGTTQSLRRPAACPSESTCRRATLRVCNGVPTAPDHQICQRQRHRDLLWGQFAP